jgi:hypothetical protein
MLEVRTPAIVPATADLNDINELLSNEVAFVFSTLESTAKK